PRAAVLIPAHDEETGIARTLRAVAAQLGPDDRVLVVADNCTDATAVVARAEGAGVVERADRDRRGKGYALAFGRDTLAPDPPEVVVVVDADCTLGPDALARVAAAGRDHPAQAAYRMTAPEGAGPDRRVAAFAFLVKNVVRPLGLGRLGGPCVLTGTGMGFPWAVFRDAPLAHGHIVEDMGLAVDLAAAGHPPRFVPEAEVWGEFPADDPAAGTQRRRWEHGHLGVIRAGVPRLLGLAVRRARPDLLMLALDIGVPPLSALVMASAVVLAALGGWAAAGGPVGPAALLGAAFGLAAVGLAGAWWRFGREGLPARTLARIPLYAVKKVGLYLDFVRKPQREWVRTDRGGADRPG
ncbi:MAG: glycosyltransferase, partial [Gemmataceae bacterium]|nr:glycosyltransferase [Gemmataceae bacterium]